ncbi:zinc-binding dehydrogenase [Aurantiacibacter atlanticus]|uniref:zinc-binding dehydrogenase n=1 Tax=Aurantiacibacter atlanticus TaxID=1648404 RepID=UPI001D123DC9
MCFGRLEPATAKDMGPNLTINTLDDNAAEHVNTTTDGGAQGVLVTAVSVPAFAQALKMVRRKGTIALTGLPPGEFPTPIFDVVLKRITMRGSIVGNRRDLAEAVQFANEGRSRRASARPGWRTSTMFSRILKPARSRAASLSNFDWSIRRLADQLRCM